MGVTNKQHVVIGASRGIGFAIAEKLAQAGEAVVGVGRSARPERDASFTYVVGDSADDEKLCRDVRSSIVGSSINGLVLSAGISINDVEISERERFSKTLTANVTNLYNVFLGLASCMADNSSILFISSINAIQGFPGNPGYVASKSALTGLVRALALDLGGRGVRVNSLCLGYFPTQMTMASFKDNIEFTRRADRTILGRWGALEEAADAAEFLVSPRSSYITGQSLVVDGGWVSRGL